MAYVKGQPFVPQFTDPATGALMASGTVEFYLTGTSTPTNYYTDSAGTVGGTSLTLGSGGKPSTDIYYDTGITYKIVVKDSAGTTLDTIDPFNVTDQTTKPEILTNVAAIQAADLTGVTAVQTLGYTTAGDGGNAFYRADTSDTTTVDDGFLCIVSNDSVRFKLVYDSVVYDKWAGAVYDGVTDDSTAIQKALNSGATVVINSDGHANLGSTTLTVPNFVSMKGQGRPTVTDTKGTTFLYSGTGEAITCPGTVNSVPFTHNTLSDFRIRKTVQASTKAAMGLLSCGMCELKNIRIDTDSNSYNFKYGVVFDQAEVCTAVNVDVQGNTTSGKITAAFFFTNGAQYTAGNSTNFTNVNTLINCNANSCDYGVLHDGGEGFEVIGGNLNGSHTASMRLAGLNSFSVDTVYMEGSSGTADILIDQTTSDSQSVGAGGGGTVKNCRLASTSTNCIKFNNSSIQTGGWTIFGNKFGSGRTGSAISVTSADSLRGSWIGPNVNLGGASKNYLDSNIYDNNSVHVLPEAQQEDKQHTIYPGGVFNTSGSSIRRNTTSYNRTSGSPYVVTDTDDIIFYSNNAGSDLDTTLPSGASQDGRQLTFVQVLGTNNCNISTYTLNAVGKSITIVYSHSDTTWYRVESL